ncbi:NrtR DNA-binding winged helix domain-containing protein [Emticicia sp. BO119]|uniref:NUDIX hydrolase n=1 Tax=Emticicia sp. BO119 TaxID=2757768 RepID=UPI0015F05777|nr:NUDIX domain-containing protein [Emticicia sp. BO119]MBA4851196.1 NUDIX domain-containing protein [Emticicia sp. BO119]
MQKFDTEKYISHLSIDCVIFGYKDKELKVLISKFKFGRGVWSLPGGYIMKSEGIDAAASRILKERTSLENIYLEQFRMFGDENRIQNDPHKEEIRARLTEFDPQRFDAVVTEWITSRFVSIGYYALVDINKVNPQNGEFEEFLEWRSMNDIPEMTYDHKEILTFALEALRKNLDEKLIGFNLLPETFTMREVQELYEAIYDKTFPMNNFQKKILDLNVLERLEKKFTGAQNKAPYLYRFRK